MAQLLTHLEDLFQKQHKYLNFFFEHLSYEELNQAVDLCMQCKGLVVLTGVGKSGIIAEKIAMTLTSTGTRALYLPAANFLHGDIGAVGKGDIVIALSKSGETEEIVDIVPHIKRKGGKVLAVIAEKGSRLAKIADCFVVLPVEKELCPFDLAPTTSAVVQLLFGDALAVALMQEKGFSLNDYASNHPSGTIGKLVRLSVKDLMKVGQDIPLCRPQDRLMDTIVELSNKKCGCLLVTREDRTLLGIFTDGDLRRSLQRDGASAMEKKMEDLMYRTPITVHPEQLAHTALKTMQGSRYVNVAPVIDQDKLVGIIRLHDIIHEGI